MTTGQLQQRVFLRGERVGARALIVGAEHVSFSALLTLAHAKARVVGMVTDLPRHQSFAVVRAGAALRYRTPLWTRTAVRAIHGQPRVEEVELLDLDSGETRHVGCDVVVFTADWIPDHELAVMANVGLDPATRGPRVDTGLLSGREGVFAAGNLVHAAEPADIAALSGRHAAASIAAWLVDGLWSGPVVPIVCEAPLRWLVPNGLGPTLRRPSRGRFLIRSEEFLRRPVLEIRQEERVLWKGRIRRMVPGRSTSLPWEWTRSVLAAGTVSVRIARR